MSALPKRFTGRKPRVWVDIVTREDGSVLAKPGHPTQGRLLAEDDLLGNDTTLVGPWSPWRVRHRFARSAGATR